MTVDLASLVRRLDTRTEAWRALGMGWTVGPILPNHGKPVVSVLFESVTWLGDLSMWASGEAELGTLRRADGWIVNKHYDFTAESVLDVALDELAQLIREGLAPPGALTAWQSERG